jgi:hypothetical protein
LVAISEENKVEGVAIVNLQVDSELFRSSFEIEDYINFESHNPNEHFALEFIFLTPFFQNKGRFFLKVSNLHFYFFKKYLKLF